MKEVKIFMTHRERVLAALNHREPDRVPIDFGAMRSTGIHACTYVEVKKYLGMKHGIVKVYDIMQMLAEPEREVIEYFKADIVQLHRLRPVFGIPIDRWKEGVLPNGEKCLYPKEFNYVKNKKGDKELIVNGRVVARMPKNGHWFDFASFPLADAESEKDIDAHKFDKFDEQELSFIKNQAEKLKKDYPDYAVLGEFGGTIFEEGLFTFGLEKYLTLLIRKPKLIQYFNEKLVEVHLENLKNYLAAVGDYIDIIRMGDDLGTQNGPYISPKHYRKYIKPYQKAVYDEVHRINPRVKVFLHSCGSIRPFIPDLIEIGVDILNPVQTTARDMDPVELKREFGKDIVFWGGGVETQGVLMFGTPEEVRAQVKERIEIFAPGGGYVFNQIHNILPGVPPENIVAAYDEALKAGTYC